MDTTRLPPQAVDVEQKVLGAMLQYPNAVPLILEILRPGDFYRQIHNEIFACMQVLSERNGSTDLVAVAGELKKAGKLEVVGNEAYLMELVESALTPGNSQYHARIVKEKASLRALINESTGVLTRCYEEVKDVNAFLKETETKMFELAQGHVGEGGLARIGDMLPRTFEDVEKFAGGGTQGIPSGFKELDEMTGGFQNSDLIILAGRPAMGKTALALTLAANAAIQGKKSVAFFSLDTSKTQLVQRLLCAQARISMHLLRTGKLPHKDLPRISMSAGPLFEAKIFLDDTSAMDALSIRSKAKRLKAQGALDLLIVDYLQLVSPTNRLDSREQEIAYVSRTLKAAAKDLDIPVVALSQLSRKAEGREEKRPQLSDLRESGAIEQDADVVLFVFREEVYNREAEQGKAEIIIGKQRNGPIGTVNATFIKDYAAFENYSPRVDEVVL